ncbi:hypothetical protein KSP39_PZI001917 [Platanthera zijinensis]|uniref:Uncharacterized protein n=1 Tax=Platanthera zijinensis TaxID=2320716 RepID=A0AAP0BYB8_9ASPA
MAKNSKKKKKLEGATAMDISTEASATATQAMDTSESIPLKPSLGITNRRTPEAPGAARRASAWLGRAMFPRRAQARLRRAWARALQAPRRTKDASGPFKEFFNLFLEMGKNMISDAPKTPLDELSAQFAENQRIGRPIR